MSTRTAIFMSLILLLSVSAVTAQPENRGPPISVEWDDGDRGMKIGLQDDQDESFSFARWNRKMNFDWEEGDQGDKIIKFESDTVVSNPTDVSEMEIEQNWDGVNLTTEIEIESDQELTPEEVENISLNYSDIETGLEGNVTDQTVDVKQEDEDENRRGFGRFIPFSGDERDEETEDEADEDRNPWDRSWRDRVRDRAREEIEDETEERWSEISEVEPREEWEIRVVSSYDNTSLNYTEGTWTEMNVSSLEISRFSQEIEWEEDEEEIEMVAVVNGTISSSEIEIADNMTRQEILNQTPVIIENRTVSVTQPVENASIDIGNQSRVEFNETINVTDNTETEALNVTVDKDRGDVSFLVNGTPGEQFDVTEDGEYVETITADETGTAQWNKTSGWSEHDIKIDSSGMTGSDSDDSRQELFFLLLGLLFVVGGSLFVRSDDKTHYVD